MISTLKWRRAIIFIYYTFKTPFLNVYMKLSLAIKLCCRLSVKMRYCLSSIYSPRSLFGRIEVRTSTSYNIKKSIFLSQTYNLY